MEPVYFDHNATTPLDDGVLEAMLPYLRGRYGNASSRHEFGHGRAQGGGCGARAGRRAGQRAARRR